MARFWKVRVACLAAAAMTAIGVQSRTTNIKAEEAQATAALRARIPGVPLFFVPNQGQSDSAVRFQTRALGGAAFFTDHEMVLGLPRPGGLTRSARPSGPGDPRSAALDAERGVPIKFVRVRFVGASPAVHVEGATRLPALVHEFRPNGANSSSHANLPTYASVIYRELYDGVDLQYAEENGRLKATYTVAPGVDPSIVRWRYEGTSFPQLMRAEIFASVCRHRLLQAMRQSSPSRRLRRGRTSLASAGQLISDTPSPQTAAWDSRCPAATTIRSRSRSIQR